MACVEACPVGIEHVPTIVDMRRNLVDEGRMDPLLQQTLEKFAMQGNSYGKSGRMRARWTKGLDFAIPTPARSPVAVRLVRRRLRLVRRARAARLAVRGPDPARRRCVVRPALRRRAQRRQRRAPDRRGGPVRDARRAQHGSPRRRRASRRSSPPTRIRSTPCATSIRSSASTSPCTTTRSSSPTWCRAASCRCTPRSRAHGSPTTIRAISPATTGSPRRRGC